MGGSACHWAVRVGALTGAATTQPRRPLALLPHCDCPQTWSTGSVSFHLWQCVINPEARSAPLAGGGHPERARVATRCTKTQPRNSALVEIHLFCFGWRVWVHTAQHNKAVCACLDCEAWFTASTALADWTDQARMLTILRSPSNHGNW